MSGFPKAKWLGDTGLTNTAPTSNLRGRMVIRLPFENQFIALGQKNAKRDRFFMSELDSLWRLSESAAQRVLDHYKSLGYTEVPVGPVVEYGYNGQVPDTDWRNDPDGFARFLIWLKVKNGMAFTLFVLPNMAPWWKGGRNGWHLDLVRRDFKAIYTHPVVQALTTHVNQCWEEVARIADMCAVFDLLTEWFPNAERGYHNPTGHLGPGESDESEEDSVRECAAHGMTLLDIQTHPPNDDKFRNPLHPGINEDGRDCLGQAAYDVRDMQSRVQGWSTSPWREKGPVLALDGKPVRVRQRESLAYEDYGENPPYDRGPEYRAAMLAIPGVTDVLDA